MQGGGLRLCQAKPTLKQPNLNKLGDAGGHKGNAKPTQDKPIFESRAVYTEHASKIGFCQRRAATEFKPACIAQLIQVALLQRQLRSAQIQGASLAYSRFLNHVRYKPIFESQAV